MNLDWAYKRSVKQVMRVHESASRERLQTDKDIRASTGKGMKTAKSTSVRATTE